MQVIKSNKVAYCDVDKTLIMWEFGDKWHPHTAHIDLLKQFKYQGYTIIIWSAGGWEWAEKAVGLLGIQDLVDFVVNKPDWFIDDLPPTDFLPDHNRIYLDEYRRNKVSYDQDGRPIKHE